MPDVDLPDPPFASENSDTILSRMLDAVDDSFNKDVGDIVWDLLAPMSYEVDQALDHLEYAIGDVFVVTATGTFLEALAAQYTTLTRNDGESDDDFRTRILFAIRTPRGAGSVGDYRTWALSVNGVGFATVEPAYNGPGTVRVLGATSDRGALDAGTIADLEAYLELVAPGTVEELAVGSITPAEIPVATTIQLVPGYALDGTVENAITAEVSAYVNSLQPGEDVSYNHVVAAILDAEGVAEVDTAAIDGASTTRTIDPDELAVLTSVTVTEA